MASGYFLYFLDLIPPTILRLQPAVKLIMMSTVPANGLGSTGALGMSSFAVPHDITQRQGESPRANPLALRQVGIMEDHINLYPVLINT